MLFLFSITITFFKCFRIIFIDISCCLPASGSLRRMIVAGRIWSGRGGWGVADSGIGDSESGNGWRIPGAESGNWRRGNRGAGNRESGNRRFPEFAEFGIRNGFGIDGCAQLCARERNSAEFAPGNRESGTRKPPN